MAEEYQEIWKDIKGYEGYYKISNNGEVKSCERFVKCSKWTRRVSERILKKGLNECGYSTVILSKKGKIKMYRTHRLVAAAFIPNPENKLEVNHINGIKTDNNVENLEWCTRTENEQHAYYTGLKKGGSAHYLSKFTEEEVKHIKTMCKNATLLSKECGYKVTIGVIAELYGVSKSAISAIKLERNWKHVKI